MTAATSGPPFTAVIRRSLCGIWRAWAGGKILDSSASLDILKARLGLRRVRFVIVGTN